MGPKRFMHCIFNVVCRFIFAVLEIPRLAIQATMSYKFCKVLTFVISAITFIIGFYFIYFGVRFVSLYWMAFELMAISYYKIPIVLIFIGGLLCLASYLGMFGVLDDHQCLLKWYQRALWTIVVIYVFLAVKPFLHVSVANYWEERSVSFCEKFKAQNDFDKSLNIHAVQKTFGCCGVGEDGYLEWKHHPVYKCDQNDKSTKCSVPQSCCKVNKFGDVSKDCGLNALEKWFSEKDLAKRIYTKGCLQTVKEITRNFQYIVTCILVLLLFGLYFNYFLLEELEFREQNNYVFRIRAPGA